MILHWNCRTIAGKHEWAKKNLLKKIAPLWATLN